MTRPEPGQTTPLFELHQRIGGRLVDFAGWQLPIQYGDGPIAEHTWCRRSAALFDVSHMGVLELRREGWDTAELAVALEQLTPADIVDLEPDRQRYGLLTNDDGGIIDDFIVTTRNDHLLMVVNASRSEIDVAHLRSRLPEVVVVERTDLALLALQGPLAATVLARLAPEVNDLVFLDFATLDLDLVDATGTATGRISAVGVSRAGYTGEDGFELLVPATEAESLAVSLLAQPEVRPAGLGARDSLRLEAGLALSGQDLDETTSPVEAGLSWTVPKRRRVTGGFPGEARILGELRDGPARRRIGIRQTGKRPFREGYELRSPDGRPVGAVTSGGYGPTVQGPVAVGYVEAAMAEPNQELIVDLRGKPVPATVTPLPFVTPSYHRGS